ncbi:hypothetical protein J7I80_09675 [Bacillus sp. ISL-41]|uniref:hypothetical protein n=1 Tax=Bacillus sp. ISL-41 TaxID=2819127 RepID=UPI001BECF20D|nr:hypothetical protein [Bacillus sp. ISL-41]MBT2642494.1 hypothetical protein [Bacillus sp. ISL-41]
MAAQKKRKGKKAATWRTFIQEDLKKSPSGINLFDMFEPSSAQKNWKGYASVVKRPENNVQIPLIF